MFHREESESWYWVVGMAYGNGSLKVIKFIEVEDDCGLVVLNWLKRWDVK